MPGIRQEYGKNSLPKSPPPHPLMILLSQFKEFMILLLLAVAILETVLTEWVEASVLYLVVIVNVLVGFFQEMKAERALEVGCCVGLFVIAWRSRR